MAGKLAIPSYLGGPKDSLVVPDIYTLTVDTPINNIEKIVASAAPDLSGALRGGKNIASSLESAAANLASKAISMTATDIAARVASALPSVSSAIGSLSAGAASNVLGSITSGSNITATISGTASSLTGSFSDASAIGSAINAASAGSFSISDPSAIVGATSGLLKQATSLGLSNAFSALTTGLEKTAINAVCKNVLPSVIKNSDLSSLSAMAVATTAGTLLGVNPNIISSVSQNYRTKPGTNNSGIVTNYNMVKNTYNAINPNWNSSTRNTTAGVQTITNLTSLIGGSKDLLSTISTGVLSTVVTPQPTNTGGTVAFSAPTTSSDQLMLVASTLSPSSVENELTKSFPNTVTGLSNRVSGGVTDPNAYACTPNMVPVGSTAIVGTPNTLSNTDGSSSTTSQILLADGTVGSQTTITNTDGSIDSYTA